MALVKSFCAEVESLWHPTSIMLGATVREEKNTVLHQLNKDFVELLADRLGDKKGLIDKWVFECKFGAKVLFADNEKGETIKISNEIELFNVLKS